MIQVDTMVIGRSDVDTGGGSRIGRATTPVDATTGAVPKRSGAKQVTVPTKVDAKQVAVPKAVGPQQVAVPNAVAVRIPMKIARAKASR